MSLGSIVVRLTMNTADFETDAGRAAKAAARRSKEIGDTFERAGRRIGIALGAGLAVAGAAFKKYMANTIEAERVQAQLASRIKDTGGAAGRSLEQLSAQAEKVQSLTIFDDETIGGAQAMLLTFKGIEGVQFDRTIEAALDLATVMGTDATDAAKLLGKALADPEKGMSALSRAGVVFTEAEREAIKAMAEAGDMAKAQDAILDKLGGTMGSAAEAARNTLGGALQGLKNAFDNLLEGDSGSDGVRGTVGAINNLTDVLNDPATRQGMDNIAGGIANIVAQTVEGIGAIARLQQSLATISGISDKRAAGAPKSAYSDKELQTAIALLSRGKRKAQASGDEATAKRLQGEITALIREGTVRIKDGLAEEGVARGFDFLAAGLPAPPKPPSSPPPRTTAPRGGSAKPRKEEISEEAKAMERLNEQAARDLESLKERLGLMGLETEAAKMRWEIEEGAYKALEPAKQAALLLGAQELDLKRELQEETEKEARAMEEAQAGYQEAIRAIREEGETLGMTNEQLEIYNRLKAAGAGITETMRQAIVAETKMLQEQRKASEDQIERMDGLRSAASGFLDDLRAGEGVWDSLARAASNFAGTLADIAQRKLIEQIFGQTGSAQGGAGGGLMSLFTSFVGSLFGGGGASAASSGGQFGWVGNGYATGGWTGPGATNQPKGIVHADEVVWSKGDVARAGGVAQVESMRRGSASVSSEAKRPLVVFSEAQMLDALAAHGGLEKVVVHYMERNRDRLRANA